MASLTTFFTQHLPSLQTTAPALATTLGLLGFGGGLYTYLSPSRAPALFGIIPPTSEIQSSSSSSSSSSYSSSSHDSAKADRATLLAYVRMHGARNTTYGFVVVSLSLYAMSLATRQPLEAAAAAAVRKCLGIVMLASVPVLTEDALVLAERVKAEVVGRNGASTGIGGSGSRSENESEKKETQEGMVGGKISNDKDKDKDPGVGHLFFGFLTALVGLGCLVS